MGQQGMEKFWTVSESGYLFENSRSEENEQWKWLTGELEMLYSEGKARFLGDHYVIDHDRAASFDEAQRRRLGLPFVFPYQIFITSHGSAGLPGFSFAVTYGTSPQDIIVNPKVIGSYIEIHRVGTGLSYIFNKEQYELVSAVTEANDRIAHEKDRRKLVVLGLEVTAKIKDYIHRAEAVPDPYLRKTKVIAPDALSVKVEENGDGSYTVKPVLLKQETDGSYRVEGESFAKTFSKRFNVPRTCVGEDGTQYVISDTQAEGLQKIKDLSRVDKTTASIIKKQPRSLFPEQVFSFDLDLYSDRVQSIGNYIRKSNPFGLSGIHGHWLPDEDIDAEEPFPTGTSLAVNELNVDEIHDLILCALKEQKTHFPYGGQEYPITEDLVNRVDSVYTASHPTEEKEDEADADAEGQPENNGSLAKNILIIKDNGENLDYSKTVGPHNKTIEDDLFVGLRPEIHLFPHQVEGARHMARCWEEGHKGILLADDMGLGKTLQAYTFISALKAALGSIKSVLIVAPVSLLKNWDEEYEKFVKPGLFDYVEMLYGSHLGPYKRREKLKNQKGTIEILDLQGLKENCILLTTYETLRTYQLSFGQIPWSVMIIDEAQKIKNPDSLVSMAVRGMNYGFGIALTGTPVENSWIDLWTIMDFVAPGKMHSQKEFTNRYVKSLQNIMKTTADTEAIEGLGNELRQGLEPLFIRRLKKDVAKELPPKEIRKAKIMMPPVQRMAYESIIHRARQTRKNKEKLNPLQIISDLRAASLYPNLAEYNEERFLSLPSDQFFMSSARLQQMLYDLNEICQRNEKVIIFVILRLMQKKLRVELGKLFSISIPVPINGEVEAIRRQALVDEFNRAEGFHILILSPEAAGVGLNITGANNVIHLSRSWNPAKEDQATDRVYRIGQKRNVRVYIPLAYDPKLGDGECFDEKLDKLLDFKRSLSEVALIPSIETQRDQDYLMGCVLDGDDHIFEAARQRWKVDELRNINETAFRNLMAHLLRNMGYSEISKIGSRGTDLKAASSRGESLFVRCIQSYDPDHFDLSYLIETTDAAAKHKNSQAILMTNGKVGKEGRQYAEKVDVRIIDGEELDRLLATHPILK